MTEGLCEIICNACGVEFSFSSKIENVWRTSGKTFVCPNGHPLAWSKEVETPDQKELKKLRIEVKELKEKLNVALTQAAEYKVKNEELVLELELWKPSEQNSLKEE